MRKSLFTATFLMLCLLAVAVSGSFAFDTQACKADSKNFYGSRIDRLMATSPSASLSQEQIRTKVKRNLKRLNQAIEQCDQGIAPTLGKTTKTY